MTAADAAGGSRSPVPLATAFDVYCYGYIGDPSEPMPNSIQGYEDVEMRAEPGAVAPAISGSVGDLVWLNGGTSTGLVAGDLYIVVEPGDLVTHPRKHTEVVGRQYLYTGQIRVLCADDGHARGIITQSCMDIHVGARLKRRRFHPLPRIPDMPEPAPLQQQEQGLHRQSPGRMDTALGELVQVDLGRDQPSPATSPSTATTRTRRTHQVLGQVGVLTTLRTPDRQDVAMRSR
jgi:hypothetical protein